MKKVLFGAFGVASAFILWGVMTALDYIDEYKLDKETFLGTLFVVIGPLVIMACYFLVSRRDVRPKMSNMIAWLVPFSVVALAGGALICKLALDDKYIGYCHEHILMCTNGFEYVNLWVTTAGLCVIAYVYSLIIWLVRRKKLEKTK